MRVSACLVTRGDVPMQPILDSLPGEWEKIVWDNKQGPYGIDPNGEQIWVRAYRGDLSVYGRYAAIEFATGDLIWVQDDDVIVSDPHAIVDAWCDGGPGFPCSG